MAGTVPAITQEWLEALRSATGRLASGGAGAHIFLESREDRRAALDTAGGRESVATRLAGASVRVGLAGPTHFLTDPAPETLKALADGGTPKIHVDRAAATMFQETPRTADPFRALERVLDGALRERPGGARLTATARWVAFDQLIAVARGDGVLATDRRQGVRVRLDVRLAAGVGEAGASVERVIRGGETGLEEVGSQAVRRAAERLQTAEAPSGEVSAVFAPGAGGVVIHEIVGHALEADTMERGASMLRAGERVAPRGVSITDDPRRGRGAWKFDDEGTATRATLLIGEGRVAGRLYDQRTAAITGAATTGHGRRASFRDPVRPRMGCTFLVPGSRDREELISEVERGVHVRRIEAINNDTASGFASFRVSDADLIEGGRIAMPLRPFLLHAHAIEALSSLRCVAEDLEFDACIGTCLRDGQPVPTSVGAPTFRIGVIRVSY